MVWYFQENKNKYSLATVTCRICTRVALLPQLICKGFARRPFCPSLKVVLGLMAPQETVSVISRCYLSAVLFRRHHAALHRARRYLSSPATLGRSREQINKVT